MSLSLVRAADRPAIPWKNGGGITRDVALSGAGPNDFVWRVSIADIERPGPFSTYPGIDRQFVLLAGRLRLTIDGRTIELTAESDPIAFPGEAVVSSEPLEGSQALNVMTRRGAARSDMRRIADSHASPVGGALLVLATGEIRTRCDHEGWTLLSRHDAALIGPPCALAVEGDAWLISLAAD